MELPIHLNVAAIAVQSQELELNIEAASKQHNNKSWGWRVFTLKIGSGILGLLGPNGAGKSTLS